MSGTDPRLGAGVAGLVDPSRVRMARELVELTQQELARRARSFTSAALSQIELGHARPSAATLEAIARATLCPPEFFIRRFGDVPAPGFFRSMKSAPARKRRQQLARARLLHDLVEIMEEHLQLPELSLPRVDVTATSLAEVEAAAAETRRAWHVDAGPIPNVVRLLERHGLVVVRVRTFRTDIDAFSVHFEDRPVIVLGADKGVTARSRFDAAHELGHQVLHRGTHPQEPGVEEQAQQFAAAFLMPASMIRRDLPATADWARLMELKTTWRVSMQALLRRAHTLEVMSDHQYDNARKAMSARGWLRTEPGDDQLGPVEAPVMVERALGRLEAMGYPVQRLAAEAHLPIYHLHEIITRTQFDRPTLDI